jgi:hypothetical protein
MDGARPGRSHITRRALLRLALASPLVPGIVALPTVQLAAAPRPIRPQRRRVRLDGSRLRRVEPEPRQSTPDRPRPRSAYVSDEIETASFRIAAFTWDDTESDAALLIRARERGTGQWSAWFELRDDGHGPDPDADEAQRSRRGTGLIIVGDSDAVEARIELHGGDVPRGLQIELIDPGESPADATVGLALPGTAAAATPKPTIHTRVDWGADESMRGSPPEYGDVRGAFVHHTDGTNSYTEADVPGIIRGIYAYHVEGRGWRDIGYNFLVDKFGRIWEGRYGGIEEPVIGAHVTSYNRYSTGMAVLGNYISKEPEPAVMTALQKLISWKFGMHEVNVWGTVSYPDLQTLPTVAGHRDGGSTECPGTSLYNRLRAIRSKVDAALWRDSRSQIYLFSNDEYVRFSNVSNGPDAGFPKKIAGNWPGLPASFQQGIDAAFWRESNGKIYFFKGDEYVRYSRVASGVDPGYPRKIAGNWPGLPAEYANGIDSALMRRSNGRIYFFNGATYVRYTRVAGGIDAGYPRWIDENWMPFPL